jgi:hypothetical protein
MSDQGHSPCCYSTHLTPLDTGCSFPPCPPTFSTDTGETIQLLYNLTHSVKVKVLLRVLNQAPCRDNIWSRRSIVILNSVLGGGEGSASPFGPFTSGQRTAGTHWIGGWLGPCHDDVWGSAFLTSVLGGGIKPMATGYGLDGRGLILGRRKTFLCSTASRPALGPTHPPIQ